MRAKGAANGTRLMRPELLAVFGIFLFFIILEMMFTRFFHKPGQTTDDGKVEVLSTVSLTVLIQPMVLFASAYLAQWLAPGAQGSLATLPWYAGLLLFLVFDDLVQYWWHRTCHVVPWLYKLHRPHHDAAYLSIRVVYRNNAFYYLLMPNLWFSGVLLYLGLGWVYAGFLVFKMLVIFGAHSDLRWDAPLYRINWLSPLMWVLERTISTPATHAAHHGKHADDGVTHYKGNYGNLLFFWDVLFGTAKITRRYPEEFGVEHLPPTTVAEQMIWPLVKSSPPIRKQEVPSPAGQ